MYYNVINAQVIKVDNGLSKSVITDNQELFESKRSFALAVGIDYLERQYFYVSSQVGYYSPEINLLLTGIDWEIKEKEGLGAKNLYVNTTFRLKYPVENHHVFIGLGPNMGYFFNSKDYVDIESRKILVGLKSEIGFNIDYKDFRIGLNYAYLLHINKMDFLKYNDNQIFVCLGYKLR